MTRALGFAHFAEIKEGGKREREKGRKRKEKNTLSWGFSTAVELKVLGLFPFTMKTK